MSNTNKPTNDDTARFHQIVKQGSLEELKTALEDGADPNAPGHVGMTALMLAIGEFDLAKMKLLIDNGADPEVTNNFNNTALFIAVECDFEDGVRLLVGLGVDRGYIPKYPLKAIAYGSPLPIGPMPEALRQTMSEEEWKASIEVTLESIRESAQNPTIRPTICEVQSLAVLQLFLKAGDDLNLAPREVRRQLLGMTNGGKLRCRQSDYEMHTLPRYGTRNPELIDFPFWREMIRTGVTAYAAREQFRDTEYRLPGPVWCYDRFGSSVTPLDDGRFVQIGGEHEDFYDTDFCIYNDVVIHDGKGEFQIYGYPRDVFPPTDFHTATLVGKSIYIVGCLGYVEQRREGNTPVFRLKLDTWEIEPVEPTGEAPGWIHRHHARFDPARNAICISGGELCLAEDESWKLVPNEGQFELDVSRLEWRRIE